MDFLEYPACIVEEVMHLQRIEGDITEEIEAGRKRADEWHKKLSGRSE